MFGDIITMGQAVTVCVFSLAVVFIVLLTISYIIDFTAWILKRASGKKAPTAPAASAPAAPAAAGHDDTADALLAAAAVAAYLGKSTDQFVVRSIRRATSAETSWSQTSRVGSAQ